MIHVFPYSKRKGTPAATMSGQIPEQIKHTRVSVLSQVAAQIRKQILDGMTDHVYEVLIESYENGVAKGHTASFVEITFPMTVFEHAKILPIRVVGNNGTVCYGEIVSSPKGES